MNDQEMRERAKEMRSAIDALESAMMGWTALLDLPENCSLDKSDSPDLELKVTIVWGQLQRILNALQECTRIINSEEYRIS